jgi:hypothetical protein
MRTITVTFLERRRKNAGADAHLTAIVRVRTVTES